MPPADGADLIRIIAGRSGRVVFQTELLARFNYGASVPWVNRLDDDSINADCWAGALGLADAGLALRRRSQDRRRIHGRGRPVYSLCPVLWIFISKSAAADRSFPGAGAHKLKPSRSPESPMERSLPRRRTLDGSGETLAHHRQRDARNQNCRGGAPAMASSSHKPSRGPQQKVGRPAAGEPEVDLSAGD